MDNENEVVSATNETEGELEIVLDDTVSKDQYNQVFARAKRAEEEKKALKAQLEEAKKASIKTEVVKEDKPSYGANFEEALELRFQGYSKEAVDFILKNGGLKSLDNPYVKAAVQSIKEQEKAEKSIPTNDSGKSDIEKKYTHEQLMNMSAAELEKILPKSNR